MKKSRPKFRKGQKVRYRDERNVLLITGLFWIKDHYGYTGWCYDHTECRTGEREQSYEEELEKM